MKTQEKITAGVLATIVAIAGGTYVANKSSITCNSETVPYVETIEKTDILHIGQSQVKFAGVNGINKVCRNESNEVVSTAATLPPINQVTMQGIQQAVTPPPLVTPAPPASTVCSGYPTLCNDGSCSGSTGRGTCSHHGGIDRYL